MKWRPCIIQKADHRDLHSTNPYAPQRTIIVYFQTLWFSRKTRWRVRHKHPSHGNRLAKTRMTKVAKGRVVKPIQEAVIGRDMHKLIDSENHGNVNKGQSMDFEEVLKGLTIAFVVDFIGRLSKK